MAFLCEKICQVTLEERIACLSSLGAFIEEELAQSLRPVIEQSIIENPWFTEGNVKTALSSVAHQYLSKDHLVRWASSYGIKESSKKRVGLVLAGNIPMVGIHDVISVFTAGHVAHLKYSSKDKVLIKRLIDEMATIDDRSREYFKEVDKLTDIDAVIATGGDTAATHFEYYFSKYPHIIRKNRSSVAVLTGNESVDDFKALGKDIFTYFGLGCRNVAKIYVPKGYEFNQFYEAIIEYSHVIEHNKYKNNYDYTHAIYLLGQHPFLTNNFLIIREDESMASRISCLHYESYENLESLSLKLINESDQIQCIASSVSLQGVNVLPLGACQEPGLDDYADGVDTMAFLTELYD